MIHILCLLLKSINTIKKNKPIGTILKENKQILRTTFKNI